MNTQQPTPRVTAAGSGIGRATGFELTSPGQPGAANVEAALVIHHTQCGTGALADDTFRRRYAQRIGTDEAALRGHAVLDPATTVTGDVEGLRFARSISPRVTVSGHVYDVVTGLVQTLTPAGRRGDRTVP